MQRRKILTAVIGAAFVAAVPVAGAQTLEGPPPTTPPIVLAQCAGQPATILGGAGADTLDGTPGDDVIVGFGGNDTIRGKGGNDTVCGGNGK
jgi:Ca2+-binding RTX toxin-like protein